MQQIRAISFLHAAELSFLQQIRAICFLHAANPSLLQQIWAISFSHVANPTLLQQVWTISFLHAADLSHILLACSRSELISIMRRYSTNLGDIFLACRKFEWYLPCMQQIWAYIYHTLVFGSDPLINRPYLLGLLIVIMFWLSFGNCNHVLIIIAIKLCYWIPKPHACVANYIKPSKQY